MSIFKAFVEGDFGRIFSCFGAFVEGDFRAVF